MRGRIAEVGAVLCVATIVTVAIAAPVLRAPSERMFGMEIVGRHYDPFLVMEQFAGPFMFSMYSQPVTDLVGGWFVRLSGPVAGYNWLVLLSFPLSAAAAYGLARHLTLSPAAAGVVAMAYAFSPFHLAQAAYHPHIAQTQWVPLYLLALFRCLDTASPSAMGFLAIATAGVTLSNFYGGLIAAVVTPVAIAAYGLTRPRTMDSTTSLILTMGVLGLLCTAGLAYVWSTAPGVLVHSTPFTMASGDVFRYSAKWWSYFVPPVAHPLLGAFARRTWSAAAVHEGLLEQQVSLGWGIVALALIALIPSRVAASGDRQPSQTCAPLLGVIAVAALVCSLAPERTTWGVRFTRPSTVLHDFLPMFRAYARFGVVVQLMTALMAGIGIDRLRRSGTNLARIACTALVVLAASEYVVSPSALSRDVLPTAAHRWVAQQPGPLRVLDCTPLDRESESVQWLTDYRVALLTGAIRDCAEPNLSEKLAAHGFSHLLLRRGAADAQWFARREARDGLRLVADFDDGRVFAVAVPAPAIYTDAMTGFSPRERDAERTWRWMGSDASWTIVNATARPIVASLDVEVSAFHQPRRMDVLLDGRYVQTLIVEPSRRPYQIDGFAVTPGAHELAFHPRQAATVAADVIGNGDRRPLSFAFGLWTWSARGDDK